jgi:HAD superfamily hydrolase (TIGR01509 family)
MSGLRRPVAILFDLDGTLVDTVGVRVQAWTDTFPKFGIEPDPAFLPPLMGSDGRLLARMVAEHSGVALAPGMDEDIDRLAGERFGELNRHPRPLRGAAEILGWLDQAGLAWAIATSSRPEEALASVSALGLRRSPLVIDGGDVEHAKPAPDLLLKAAGKLATDPRDTWYVGDSKWDMLAAVAAGMGAVGVTTGATPEDDLVAAGAGLAFDDLAELHGYLIAEVTIEPRADDGSSAGSG